MQIEAYGFVSLKKIIKSVLWAVVQRTTKPFFFFSGLEI